DLILGEAVHDCDVLALDIAGVLEALAKRAQTVRHHVGRSAVEEPDHRHRRLLRARRKRPRNGSAGQKADEISTTDWTAQHVFSPRCRSASSQPYHQSRCWDDPEMF